MKHMSALSDSDDEIEREDDGDPRGHVETEVICFFSGRRLR